MSLISCKDLPHTTSLVFKSWTVEIRKLVQSDYSSVVLPHAKDRMAQRGITMQQVMYALSNLGEKSITKITTSTRGMNFKFRVVGKDLEDKEIAIIIIPGTKGYKILTTFYTNETNN